MKRFLLVLLVVLAACAPQRPAEPELPSAAMMETPAPEVPAEQVVVGDAPVALPPPEEPSVPEAMPVQDGPVVVSDQYATIPVGSGKVQGCPEGYSFAGGYCVEDACQNKQVKCMVSGNLVKRPDCECWMYLGEPICSIKAAEETRIQSPLCRRKGQVGGICGAYDSNKKHCVVDTTK